MAQSAPATVTIANSPHNLNNVGVALPQQQICLPCHTPHNSTYQGQGGSTGSTFIWNHTVQAGKSYTLYSGSPGLDNTSLLCLSCHDGAIAVDSYTSGAGPGAATTFMGKIADSFGTIGGGAIAGASGSDLTYQHPVGVTYPGSTNAGGKLGFSGSTSFNDPTQSAFKAGGVGGSSAVSLTTLPDGTFGVGCGTCHTPHTYTYKFVRMDNTGSALCLRCHIK
jgi:predicted CXXCH cytochrome family protein